MKLLTPLFFAAFSLAALAQEPPPAADAAKKAGGPRPERNAKAEEPRVVVTERTINIAGKAVPYKVTTGYLVLKEETDKAGKADEKDALKPKARIFFIAYTRTGTDAATRPLAFAFNGGPGAASVWLHLGGLGPRRVQLGVLGDGTPPPYRLVDNEFSWLDDTDLVFVDPVSTGFSRPEPGENARAFHGFQEDLQAMAEFIRHYLTQNQRWLSPKLLIGESYGGTRAAALAGLLQDRHDLYLNGIVIVSGVLNWQGIDFHPGNDLSYAVYLPAYAATARFHRRLAPELQAKSAEDLQRAAETFAMTDYWIALAKGSALTPDELAKTARTVAQFTGLTEEVLIRYRLRVPVGQYMDELLKHDRRAVGRFDSRLIGIMSDPDGSDFDPSFTTMRGNFTATANEYLRSELKFESELPYRSLANVSPWNFGNVENRYLDVADNLTRAMTKNPHLKVWVLAGYFDLAVSYFTTDYTLRHMPLAPELRPNIRFTKYESGHMIYTDTAQLQPLKDDFHVFMAEALKARAPK